MATRGILLIAHGHPNYYRMAFNCAVSLKATSGLAVALVCGDGYEYSSRELMYFDHVIPIEEEYSTLHGEINYTLLKLNMFHLSPFEETIYMDCDSLALYARPLEQLYLSASAYPIQFDIQNEKCVLRKETDADDVIHFSHLKRDNVSIWQKYEIPSGQVMYDIQSTFAYFRKEPKAQDFFDMAIRLFKENKLGIAPSWKGRIMDEPFFMIAQAVKALKMQVPFTPVYYPSLDGYIGSEEQLERILNEYYFYSIPGTHSHEVFLNLYNELIKEYYRHEKLDPARMFFYQNKHEYMPERISL